MTLRTLVAPTALLVATIATAPARAQSNDTVTAEALFQQGRSLLLADRIDEACPKLAESFRVDPATGTLAALAMCHEKQGKIASAWAEFTDVESRARREGREDRQKLARESADALRPRLSTLELRVPPQVAALRGLEVRRDGVVQGTGVYDVAIPIDGGTHRVEVTAPGRRAWIASVSVKAEGDRASLAIGMPEPEPESRTPTVASGATGASAPKDTGAPAEGKPFGTLEWLGIGTAGVGVVSLGVGGYFLATALGERADSKNDCEGNVCNDAGLQKRADAVNHGNLATIFGIAGGALVATGATLYLVGRSSGSEGSAARTITRVSLVATPAGAVVDLRGTF